MKGYKCEIHGQHVKAYIHVVVITKNISQKTKITSKHTILSAGSNVCKMTV